MMYPATPCLDDRGLILMSDDQVGWGSFRASHFDMQGPVQAPLRDAFKSVQDHGIIENPSDHTILIVDDDETNIRVLNTLLSREGYNTVYALSGFQALELFAQAMPKPSCVLLDIGLPDISGVRYTLQSSSFLVYDFTTLLPKLPPLPMRTECMAYRKPC